MLFAIRYFIPLLLGLQAELTAAHKDSELVRKRMNRLEEDLNEFKQKNMELAEELVRKAGERVLSLCNEKRVAELESSLEEVQVKVKTLETELQSLQKDRDSLQKEREDMLAEREEEMKIVQEALEESQEEKMAIQARFEKDFERLRTVNTDREQQLLDDFEWKLREVEQACKRRLEEKDKVTEERIREMKRTIEGKVKVAEKQLQENDIIFENEQPDVDNEVIFMWPAGESCHLLADYEDEDEREQLKLRRWTAEQLKSYEAEVTQLRGLTHEQQRSLRVATRQTEQLQVSEKMLKEEISRLQSSLNKEKAHYSAMQTIHDRRMAELEKKLQARLDQQSSELTAFWEDRVRKECSRFKAELDLLHSEEKKLAVEAMRLQKEQELKTAKLDWERRMQDSHKEIASLKERVVEKDSYYSNELERSQTNADRDILELRRKLDKLDLQYQEQIEKLVDKHEKEIDSLNEDAERKVQQLEQNWQLQMSSTRATLELVKEQMERDAQSRLEAAGEKHRNQLAMQWEQLLEEKEKALEVEVEKHRGQLDKMKQELEHAVKARNIRESELLETIEQLRAQLDGQSTTISDLEGNVDLLEGGMQVLNQQITTQSHEMTKVQQQAAIRISDGSAGPAMAAKGSHFPAALSVFLIPFFSWVLSGSFTLILSSLLVAFAVLQPAEPPPPFPPPTRPPSYRLPPLLTIHFLVPPCRERDATREAELHRRLGELATKHAGQQKQWQAQMCQMQEAAQKKINHLLQLLEESHQQCENCKSRPEDTQLIADLRKIVSEKDRELASLTEEKRFYQMELVNRETNNNRLFNSQPIVGVMDALQHRRCKGSSGGCAPSNKANSKQITLVTSSHLPSPVSDSVVQRSHSMDLQELVFSVPSDRCQSLDSSVSLPLPSANSTNNECSLQPDTVP
uniref:Uncharacterized protein n=1 Tax=Timema monikensis TaxID=170555 RepID=A0A7R9EBE8_9NEOP|nr:unnamed protein product [Timema monikensis]